MNYKMALSVKYVIDKIIRRKRKLKFNKHIASMEISNQIVSDVINLKQPIAIGKFGEIELQAVRNYLSLERVNGKNEIYKLFDFFKYEDNHEWTVASTMWKNTGFFPVNVKNLELFSTLYISIVKKLDFFATAANLGGWYANKNEDYVINRFYNGKCLLNVGTFEPVLYNLKNHWLKTLEGKKVLVIHPFAESIQKNYANRHKIFKEPLLPDFKLEVLKSVQSAGEMKPTEFNTWFDALDYQKQRMNNIEFDVALIGAGAYGLPLAVHAKELGKQGIHIGGALQLYFGILGLRWDNNPAVNKIKNEHWTRPLASETPEGYRKVGDGFYSYW